MQPRSAANAEALMLAAVFSAGLLLAAAAYKSTPLSLFLAGELEQRFAPPSAVAPEGVTGIIALGGSHERVVEAMRLAREFPNAKVVVTGASPEDEAYAQEQEFAKDRLVIEPNAKNTFENALFSRRLLAPESRDRWLIVTSAVHMPRAMGAFREAGFAALPWPVFDRPTIAADVTHRTLHEVFGLLEYWILGRIASPFPAPGQ